MPNQDTRLERRPMLGVMQILPTKPTTAFDQPARAGELRWIQRRQKLCFFPGSLEAPEVKLACRALVRLDHGALPAPTGQRTPHRGSYRQEIAIAVVGWHDQFQVDVVQGVQHLHQYERQRGDRHRLELMGMKGRALSVLPPQRPRQPLPIHQRRLSHRPEDRPSDQEQGEPEKELELIRSFMEEGQQLCP